MKIVVTVTPEILHYLIFSKHMTKKRLLIAFPRPAASACKACTISISPFCLYFSREIAVLKDLQITPNICSSPRYSAKILQIN